MLEPAKFVEPIVLEKPVETVTKAEEPAPTPIVPEVATPQIEQKIETPPVLSEPPEPAIVQASPTAEPETNSGEITTAALEITPPTTAELPPIPEETFELADYLNTLAEPGITLDGQQLVVGPGPGRQTKTL